MSRGGRRRLRRAAAALALGAGWLGVGASPVAADPPGPTHYVSTVTEVRAADGGDVPVDVEVLGGDAFLRVAVAPGTTLEVPGYEGEPYVRIGPDGTVEVNHRAPSHWLNVDRYVGSGTRVPPDADAAADPDWRQVADGGVYAWHDHRIHYMAPSLPAAVDPDVVAVQHVQDWQVPLLVDDREVVVSGRLAWAPGPSPLVAVAGLLVAATAAIGLTARRPGLAGVLVASVGAAALAGAAADRITTPPGAEHDPVLLVLPLLALTLLAAAAGLGRRQPGRAGWLRAAAGLPLLVWGAVQAAVLVRPLAPGLLPVGLTRVVVAAAVVAGLTALAAGLPTAVTAGPARR